jgi:hypothetical protein
MGSPDDSAYPPTLRPHAIRPKMLNPATADKGNAIIWRPVERLIRAAYMHRAAQTPRRAASGRKI